MAHNTVYKAINGTLQDILNNTLIFGGTTVLLSGDFRKLLPVVNGGTRAQIVKASVKISYV